MNDSEILKEIRDRTRRTETRLTKYMTHQGFDVETAKCVWVTSPQPSGGYVAIPSRQCSIQEILAVIPPDVPDFPGVSVYCKGDWVTSVRPWRRGIDLTA